MVLKVGMVWCGVSCHAAVYKVSLTGEEIEDQSKESYLETVMMIEAREEARTRTKLAEGRQGSVGEEQKVPHRLQALVWIPRDFFPGHV